jgi:hypothetical protein
VLVTSVLILFFLQVRKNKWHYFAHELAHQLGVVDHVKGKEANGGDYIMENFVQEGEFASSSKEAMKEYIELKVNKTGDCL